jgi:hypothetical protein
MRLSRNLKRLFRLGAALPPVEKAEPEARSSGSRPTRRLAAGTGHKAPETHPAPPNAAALGEFALPSSLGYLRSSPTGCQETRGNMVHRRHSPFLGERFSLQYAAL